MCSKYQVTKPRFSAAETVASISNPLIYSFSPCSGEGESVRVLLAFMSHPYSEQIRPGSALLEPSLVDGDLVLHGTLACLLHLGKTFQIEPRTAYAREAVEHSCALLCDAWQGVREAFYWCERQAVAQFYSQTLPLLLVALDRDVAAWGESLTVGDFLVLTFVENLFARKEGAAHSGVLERYSPAVKRRCEALVATHTELTKYFSTRDFRLFL